MLNTTRNALKKRATPQPDGPSAEVVPSAARRKALTRGGLIDLAAVCCMLPTFLAGTAAWWWIGDLFTHFRVQYVGLLLPLCLLCAVRRRWRMTLVLVAVLAANVMLIAPLYFGGRESSVEPASAATISANSGGDLGARASADSSVRLLSANVFVGNPDTQSVIDLVREEQPDLFLAIEVNPRWQGALEALREEYPHVIAAMRENGYGGFDPFGMSLFSRQPATVSEVRRVGAERLPVIVAAFDLAHTSLTVVAAHPYPPVRADCAAIRNEYLAAVGDIAATIEGPCVLLGDLNTTSFSPLFARLVRRSGLRDSRRGFGIQPTWPDGHPLLAIPIDHALVSEALRVIDRRVGPSIGSDHRPLILELGVR